MSHQELLYRRVSQLQLRIRLLVTQRWICAGLTGGLLAGIVLVAATRFQWWLDAVDYLWAPIVIGAVVGLIYGWTRPVTALDAALIGDERAGLKERLSTAVELSRLQARSDVADAQIADAAQHAESLRSAEILPWRAPRQWRYVAGALALLLAAIFVPELSFFHSHQDRIDRDVMHAQGIAIQKVAKEMERQAARKKESDEDAAILKRVAQQMKELGKEQERGRISKKQAMLQLNDLQKQLRDQQNRNGQGGGGQKSLDRVASDLRQQASRRERQGDREGAQALQKMADSLSKKDLNSAKQQLEEMARKMQDGKMSAEDAGKAAETLEQMAKSMEDSDLKQASQQMKDAAKQLRQAADAARQLQKQMQQAKSDGQRQQLQKQAQQQMQQAMASAASKTQQAGGT